MWKKPEEDISAICSSRFKFQFEMFLRKKKANITIPLDPLRLW